MMKVRRFSFILAIVFSAAMPRLQAQNSVEKIVVGNTKVTTIRRYDGADTLPKPTLVVVYDFNVPPEAITMDRSVANHVLDHDPIAHIRGTAGQNSDPAIVAAKVQAAFTKRLMKELSKTHVPVSSATMIADSVTPPCVLKIQGDFTAVKQGDMAARMMIGFGRGASDVKADVIISLTTPTQSIVLAEFNLTSESGKTPGAATTMGVGSAATSVAVSGATDNKATVDGDSSRMAKAVATQVEDIMAAAQWIAPVKKPTQTETAQTK